MPIGLIAGNGTFPFLVLRAAREMGRDVTVVAIKGEAFGGLESLAVELGGTTFTWIGLGSLGKCISDPQAGRRVRSRDGGPGQARQALHRRHARPDDDAACWRG